MTSRAELKELLPDAGRRIEFTDTVDVLAAEAVDRLTEEQFPMNATPSDEAVAERVSRLDEILGPVVDALLVGGFYGDMDYHHLIWSEVILKLVNAAGEEPTGQVFSVWDGLRSYPAVLGLYALGSSALAGNRPEALAICLAAVGAGSTSLTEAGIDRRNLGIAAGILMPDSEQFAISAWLEEKLLAFAGGILRADRFEIAFDQLEYLLSVIEAHQALGPEMQGYLYPEPARSWLRKPRRAWGFRTERWAVGNSARPWLDVGLFDGSSQRLDQVRTRFDAAIVDRRHTNRLGHY